MIVSKQSSRQHAAFAAKADQAIGAPRRRPRHQGKIQSSILYPVVCF